MQTGRKHAIGDSFGINVGEIFRGDVVDQVFLERLILDHQLALKGLVVGQRLAQHVLDEVGLARHAFSEVARAGDGLGLLGDEIAEQVFQRFILIRLRNHAHHKVCNGDRCRQSAITVKVPVEAIGVDQVGQSCPVTILLSFVVVLHASDADVKVFRLNMADDNLTL